ncbi:MAG TPA: SRPBCC family protein [Streptosporangiaceae bacterium]|nr:SRPBCC family protein [Streptosporangiaceae bacterium]
MPQSYASTVVNAPAATVWSYIRDFANLHEWLPSIETCELEGDAAADEVGAVRRLGTQPGQPPIRERLVFFDDEDRSYAYEFIESPLPVRDYRSRIRVATVTDTGQAFIEWRGEFSADENDVDAMVKFFTENVYGAGLASLRDRFA